MRIVTLLILLFLGTENFAQNHPFYSINDPVIKKELNKVNPVEYQNFFFNGLKYKSLGDSDKALEAFKNCIRLDGRQSTPMYESALINYHLGDLDQALFFIESACEIDKENKWYKQLLATTYLEIGNYSKAILTYKKLLEIEPRNEEWHFELASAYLMNRQARNAIRVYNDLQSIIGPQELLFQQKKRIYSEIGDKLGALNEIKQWVESDPQNLNALNELAELYLLSGKQNLTIKTLEKVLETDHDNASALIMLSELYRNQKNDLKAFEYTKKAFSSNELGIDAKMRTLITYFDWTENDTLLLRKSYELIDVLIQTHPEDAKPYTIAGDYYYRDQQLELARENFKIALSIDPSRYPIWQQLMIIAFDLKDYKDVISLADKAQELFPSQPTSYYFSGLANIQFKKYASAIDQLNVGKLMVLGNPNLLAQFYASLGDAYHSIEDFKSSDDSYDSSLELLPDNTYVLNNYSYFLSLRSTKLEQAAEMMKKCVELEPNQSSYEDTYAWVFYQQKNYKTALVWLEKALNNGGNSSSTIVEHYGDVLFQLDRHEEAVEQWIKAKELGSESEFLEQKIADKTLYE
ncbi:MAG: tetratricopeptide repeat protein [Flavobacteriales bacterium]